MRFFNRLSAFLIGLLFVFCFLETSLRLLYFANHSTLPKLAIDPKKFNIICIGNSHTFGAGVLKEQAYPAVLEKMLNSSKLTTKNISVFNLGKLGANSSVLLDSLPTELEQIKPNLMIILTGEPNFWTWYGYDRYLKNKNLNKDDYKTFGFFDFLNHSKVFKFFEILLRKKQTPIQFNSYTQLEKVMYLRTIAENSKIDLNTDDTKKGIMALENYISNFKNETPINARDFYYALYFLNFYNLNNVANTLDNIHRSIIINEQFDFMSYAFLQNMRNTKIKISSNESNRIDQLLQLASKNMPNNIKMKLLIEFENKPEQVYSLDDIRFLHETLPGNTTITRKYLEAFFVAGPKNEIGTSMEYVNTLKRLGPFSNLFSYLTDNFKKINSTTTNPFIYTIANDYARYNLISFPNLHNSESKQSDLEIQNWLVYDIEQMIKLAQNSNIKVIVMNYHWLKGNPKEHFIDQAARISAKEMNVKFSDIHSFFMDEVHKSKIKEYDFFAHKYGENDNHPSVLGHQIIANKLYQDILKFNFLN